MEQLVALPVSGDAFLLRRAGKVILVDGGKSSVLLAKELAKYQVHHLDIIVCTHADYDHAGGLVDLLDRSAITVGEFWLPGAWAESLPELLTSPAKVVNELIRTLDNPPLKTVQDDFEQQMHSYVNNMRKEYRDAQVQAEKGDYNEPIKPSHNRENLEPRGTELPLDKKDEEQAARAFQNGRGRVRYRANKRKVNKTVATFWLGLIDTAERIRRIAVQATNHRVSVRWFDFGEFAKTLLANGGDAGFLIPLNAVEIAPPPPPVGLSFLVRLTPVNEESLVFLSPGTMLDSPSILFTGDSPLGTGANYSVSWVQWPKDAVPYVIVTAPHHGSESNFSAYGHIKSTVHVGLWVRSGGTNQHPGKTYRTLDPALRICTHCPHVSKPRQAAEILFPLDRWWGNLRTNGHICTC